MAKLKSKKHIYIAYTGGTIGMQQSENGYIPVSGYMSEQLSLRPEFHRDEMPYYTIYEYSKLIDSSNMKPSNWQQIADDISANYDKYDGFVVLHGTDTMAYTAAALSFMLVNLAKPVIITGAQIPLAQLRSDGQTNLLNALYIAANYPINEVTLFFNNQLFRGNRSSKLHSDGFNAFVSPNFPPLLTAGINIELGANVICDVKPKLPFSVNRIYNQKIGVITLYPGIDDSVIKSVLQADIKAVILLTFGTGNAPQQISLLEHLKQAIERKILILNLSQCMIGKVNMSGYATGLSLVDIGVASGFDLTFEAAITKLHYLLSQDLSYEELIAQISQPICGELSNM